MPGSLRTRDAVVTGPLAVLQEDNRFELKFWLRNQSVESKTMAEESQRPVRLMNFVSEEQVNIPKQLEANLTFLRLL